jgi:hypothetical protein
MKTKTRSTPLLNLIARSELATCRRCTLTRRPITVGSVLAQQVTAQNAVAEVTVQAEVAEPTTNSSEHMAMR